MARPVRVPPDVILAAAALDLPRAGSPAPASTVSPAAPRSTRRFTTTSRARSGSTARCRAASHPPPSACRRRAGGQRAGRQDRPRSPPGGVHRAQVLSVDHAARGRRRRRAPDRETLKALAAVPAPSPRSSKKASRRGTSARSTRCLPTSACSRRSCSTSRERRSERAFHLHVNMRALSPADFVGQAQESAPRAEA